MPSHSTNETAPVELAEIRASLVKFARNSERSDGERANAERLIRIIDEIGEKPNDELLLVQFRKAYARFKLVKSQAPLPPDLPAAEVVARLGLGQHISDLQ